jgi:protein O-GlcNAc transferase
VGCSSIYPINDLNERSAHLVSDVGAQVSTLCKNASLAHSAGNLSQALEDFSAACIVKPDYGAAWNGRAVILVEMGRGEEAASVLTEAVAATHGEVCVLANLAILQEQLGRLTESVETAEKVLALEPAHTSARFTLGLALLRLGRPLDAARHYGQLTSEQPENPDAFLNLGEALMAADQYGEALAAYEQAIKLKPTLIAARIGQGKALAMLGRFDEADAVFVEAAHQDPKGSFACFQRVADRSGLPISPSWQVRAIEIFLSKRWIQQQVCDWRFRTDYLSQLGRYAEVLAKTDGSAYDASLAFQGHSSPLSVMQRRGLLDAVAKGIAAAAGSPVRRRLARPPGPVRIGFLSPNFREHPSAQLNWRLLSLLDRSRFKVFGYSLVKSEGPLRQRVIQSCDVFREMAAMNGWETAKRIALDGIDILVDLSGHLDYSRPEVLALRPAPLRVSFLGSPGAIGADLVDYRMTDHFTTPPEDASFWSEKLAFLPQTVAIYNNLEEISATHPSRSDCGLPEHGFVFCCFNASYKIEPEVFAVWMRLLARIPDSVLWLLDSGEATLANLQREATVQGIASERLVFAPRLPRAEHLARHACADLFLDTFHCGAMATAGDALWSGLPVLTCPGNSMAARMSGTIVRAAGLPELVVTDRDAYAATAFRLATRPDKLAALRENLARNRATCALFDTEQRVRDLGQAFTMMWERHAAGLPPATFDVPGSDFRV